MLPNATLKIFLTASSEERARRRMKQLEESGGNQTYEQVLAEIIERDWRDSHREVSPMRQAPDAVRVDTSDMTLEQSIQTVVDLARQAIARG